jgi:hypothetical protein
MPCAPADVKRRPVFYQDVTHEATFLAGVHFPSLRDLPSRRMAAICDPDWRSRMCLLP